MVFWSSRSWWSRCQWNPGRFRSSPLSPQSIPSPTGYPAERVTEPSQVSEVVRFLRAHFGSPPRTPLLDLSETTLLGPRDYLWMVRDTEGIVGTLRYHFIGTMVEPIYMVDSFCIHPRWRRKGVGDFLLNELHRYANQHRMPNALFLKEGQPIHPFPLYTGVYVFRKVEAGPHPHLRALSSNEAERRMDHFQSVYPNVLLIRRPGLPWYLYQQGEHWIMICIQDTYQRMPDGARIAWITGWIERPGTTDALRAAASEEALFSQFGKAAYLWTNRAWVGGSSAWTADGPFHWYTYQWNTSATMNPSYLIPS